MLGPLACNKPNAACSRMKQDRVAGFDDEGLTQKVLRSHALEHHRSGRLQLNRFRHFQQTISWKNALIGIRTWCRRIGNAITNLDTIDARTHSNDSACAFITGDERHLSGLVKPSPKIDIDEIQANRLVAHFRLTRTRRTNFNLFILQNVRTTSLMDANCIDHDASPVVVFL